MSMPRPARLLSTSCWIVLNRRALVAGRCRTLLILVYPLPASQKPPGARCRDQSHNGRPGGPSFPRAPRNGAWPIGMSSWRTYGRLSTLPRWWHTLRALTRSRPRAPNTAGTLTAAPWPGSGAAAASSGRASSIGSPRRTSVPTSRCCLPMITSAKPSATVWPPGGAWLSAAAQERSSDTGVLILVGLLRRHSCRTAAGCLIQAQRDFFGAHTYSRVDKDGSFHTEWSAGRTERQVGEAFKQEVPAAKESEKAPATSA